MGKKDSGLKIIWYFFSPYKWQVVILLVASLLVGSLEASTVAAVYPIVSTAFDTGAAQSNIVLSIFGTLANLLPIEDEFITYCIMFLIIALIAFAVRMFTVYFRVKFTANLVKKAQSQIFRKFVNADYQYFIDHKQGELIYNAGGAPSALSSVITAITESIAQLVLFITVIIFLFSLSWQGTIAVLAVGIIYYAFTRYLGNRVSYYSGKGEMEALRETSVLLNEAISGIKQLKVFVTGQNWIDKFNRTIDNRWYHSIKRDIWQQVPNPTLMLILYLCIGAIALFIRIIAPDSFTMLIPVFGTFAFAVFRLVPALSGLGSQSMKIMSSLPNCEVVYFLEKANITQIIDGAKELSSFQSYIVFDDVSFAYKGRASTLENMSITFEKGKTTAIVGRSGSGKTTIINLLLRLFEPDKGEIKIDEVDLRDYKLSSWLKNIGLVSQDTFILNDTVEKNITFRSDGYSREDVIKAAKYADAHDFISRLPDGYDTFVGDKGMRLSGGQAQRIAVARAMIRKPEILIFDEATNNLDNISEAAVQSAIDEISKDHTVIIVAHRLSTTVNADKIIVLEDKRVVEEGTHQELIGKRGSYWGLYQSQPV